MDRLERVKKEIERRLREGNLYVYSRTEYEDLLRFINSLYEEPKHSSLERLKIEEPILEILDRYLDRVPDEEVLKTKMAIDEWFNVYFPKLQEEPVSEDLEKAAVEAFKKIVDDGRNSFFEIFKAGAKWQKANDEHLIWQISSANYEKGKQEGKEQIMENATEAIVAVDAGGYPYIPQIELYDYDNDIPLAEEGDKYKVVLIKEDRI